MKKLFVYVVCLLMLTFAGLASAQSGDVSWSNRYKRSNANETVVLKTGPGMVSGVVVGVVGTTSSVILYDNTAASGTVIANLSTTALQTFLLNAQFTTGLTYVTSGGAAADISIAYK